MRRRLTPGAVQDLTRALQLVSDGAEQAEIQLELGVVLRRQRDYRRSVRACRAALDADGSNAQVCRHWSGHSLQSALLR